MVVRKSKSWSKSEIFFRNRNSGKKSKVWTEIEILVKSRNFWLEIEILAKNQNTISLIKNRKFG